jgi:DNA-binding winged helix-turn-helix (wHTH) protein
MTVQHNYSFGEYMLDLERGALLKNGVDVELPPKGVEVLRLLLERPGQLVTHEELATLVWKNPVGGGEDVSTGCVAELRRAIGDESQSMIRTVPGQGYVFERPVVAPPAGKTPAGAPRQDRVAGPFRAAALFVLGVILLAVAAWWWGSTRRSDMPRNPPPMPEKTDSLPRHLAASWYVAMNPAAARPTISRTCSMFAMSRNPSVATAASSSASR